MKIRNLALLGLLAYGAYKAYDNREKIRAGLAESLEAFDRAQMDWEIIQDQLQIISQEADIIKDYKEDLTYKFKVFNQEAQSRLNQINQRLEKWQGD